jgi:NAD-dependent dihydropyrimidine dehydrogenase PreA subunit/flavodoxin
MKKRVNAVYFSPTGTTEKTVVSIAEKLSISLNGKVNINKINITSSRVREDKLLFSSEDIVVLGVPVYAGRVPNILLDFLNTINGNMTLGIPIVLYGNRNYDDALIELKKIMENNGFNLVSAGAFIGEHSFSYKLAKGRPDEKDLTVINEFSGKTCELIKRNDLSNKLEVKGEKCYRDYYRPKDTKGKLYDFRKIKPKTDEKCIDCLICAKTCPMESIDFNDVSNISGICIKCGSCIKKCPVGAKYFDDDNYIKHKVELEEEFIHRKEPELFYQTNLSTGRRLSNEI